MYKNMTIKYIAAVTVPRLSGTLGASALSVTPGGNGLFKSRPKSPAEMNSEVHCGINTRVIPIATIDRSVGGKTRLAMFDKGSNGDKYKCSTRPSCVRRNNHPMFLTTARVISYDIQ
eukprot:m.304857 g.304857  ORF g.304857 m.304857 type:complete len:117 (-) comp16441_c0_seq8:153-503(-)